MKKSVKQILSGIIISVTTLCAGFIITMASFNLFGTLTANQMKILFALDVICLLSVGLLSLFLSERKKNRKIKENEQKARHTLRTAQLDKRYEGIEELISRNDLVA